MVRTLFIYSSSAEGSLSLSIDAISVDIFADDEIEILDSTTERLKDKGNANWSMNLGSPKSIREEITKSLTQKLSWYSDSYPKSLFEDHGR